MRSIVESGFLGLVCMDENIITRSWPNRLIHHRDEDPGLQKFNRYLGWVDNKAERWLEWQLEKPLGEKVRCYWAQVCRILFPADMRYLMAQAVDEIQSKAKASPDADNFTSSLDRIDEEKSKTKKRTKGKTKHKQKHKGIKK